MFYSKIIESLRSKTNEVILFHSGTGKDSIMLLDVLSKHFDKVVCVFMYIVKDLEYENNYIKWATNKYKNTEWIITPHYAVYSFIKNGYLGIKKSDLPKAKISQIDSMIRGRVMINYSVYGFKKQDSITRRIMLNGYLDGINLKTQKAYPLMDMTNKSVLNYIADNNLINPFNYGTAKPSSGCDISTPQFLDYIRRKYPKDLQNIYNQYPFCEAILFRYDNYGR